jgi:hypothetical protein
MLYNRTIDSSSHLFINNYTILLEEARLSHVIKKASFLIITK